MEMKYYIVYGNWKPELLQDFDALKKAMEEWSKVIEKAGLKVKLWGSPLGISKTSVCVYKGSPDSFTKIPFGQAPYTDSKTHVVMKI